MWKLLNFRDEYTQSSDTHFFQTRKYLFLWSEKTKVVRRYGTDCSYAEAAVRKLPENPNVALNVLLHNIFFTRRKSGTLLADEVPA